jgi:hypothetical protein
MQFTLSPYARAIVLMIGDGEGKKSFMDRKGKISAYTAYAAQTDRLTWRMWRAMRRAMPRYARG